MSLFDSACCQQDLRVCVCRLPALQFSLVNQLTEANISPCYLTDNFVTFFIKTTRFFGDREIQSPAQITLCWKWQIL